MTSDTCAETLTLTVLIMINTALSRLAYPMDQLSCKLYRKHNDLFLMYIWHVATLLIPWPGIIM